MARRALGALRRRVAVRPGRAAVWGGLAVLAFVAIGVVGYRGENTRSDVAAQAKRQADLARKEAGHNRHEIRRSRAVLCAVGRLITLLPVADREDPNYQAALILLRSIDCRVIAARAAAKAAAGVNITKVGGSSSGLPSTSSPSSGSGGSIRPPGRGPTTRPPLSDGDGSGGTTTIVVPSPPPLQIDPCILNPLGVPCLRSQINGLLDKTLGPSAG